MTLRDATLPEVAFRVAIGPAVAVFLLLAALDHFVTAAPGVHRWYERNLDRRTNYARWIEYSVSASIMIVLIGLLVGIRDLAAVIGIFAANTAMILFGLLMERQQTPGRADWSAFWFGSLVGLAPGSRSPSTSPSRRISPASCGRSSSSSSCSSRASRSTWPCSTPSAVDGATTVTARFRTSCSALRPSPRWPG
ncbi:heliorhodopsin HeR [Micromonospora sp. M12]